MSQFGKNLRHLRTMAGETQKKLAQAVNCSDTLISKYESGEREPSQEVLEAVSRRYCKTVDQLLNSDLTDIQPFSFETDGARKLVDAAKRIFPLVKTETALLNKDFRNAMRACEEMLNVASNNGSIRSESLARCGELFELAAADEQCKYEASANQLWVMMQIWNALFYTVEAQKKLSEAVYKREDRPSFFQVLLDVRTSKTPKEVEKKQATYIAAVDETYMDLVRVLKSDNTWSALGDYYLTLRFLTGMVNNDVSAEFNTQIGIQLLRALAALGNEYAYNAMKASYEI